MRARPLPILGLVMAVTLVGACAGESPAPAPAGPASVEIQLPGPGDLETHGNDPPPPRPAGPPRALPERAWPCLGDGQDGVRVEMLYVHASGQGDLPGLRTTLESYARRLEAVFVLSGEASGGPRLLRLVTGPGCTLAIRDVTVSVTALGDFDRLIDELVPQGFTRPDRKYLAWVDAQAYCGIGTVESDDQPGVANRANTGPSYARTDRACWGGSTEAHEVVHNLGGVQLSAPHTSGGWHCRDEWDNLCYPDGAPQGQTFVACTSSALDDLLDCNHDDYFASIPPAGSYLATHWNVADSTYLERGAPPTTTPPPPPPSTTVPPPTTSTTVGVGQTTTDLTMTPLRARVGQDLTLTATVRGDCRPDGVVEFYLVQTGVPARLLDRRTLNAGVAILGLRFVSAGTFTLRATYPGNTRCGRSSDSVRRVIAP